MIKAESEQTDSDYCAGAGASKRSFENEEQNNKSVSKSYENNKIRVSKSCW